MSRPFGIAGIQLAPVDWNPEATVDKISDVVGQIGRNFPWVDMILLHELVVSGLVQYVSIELDAYRKLAQPIPGPLADRLCAIARRVHKWLIPGSMYELDGKDWYNTTIVISPDGEIVARYRKMFPWLPYESGVRAGSDFCVFDVPGIGRFGLSICYDMWFPEFTRQLMWMGAEVILHPTMTPTSDRALELVLSQANAIFNQCYFVDINGVGPYGGGQSMIVDPDGRVLQKAGSSQTILTEIIDLDNVTRTREFGTLGLAQTLKQLRDSNHEFPIYQQGVGASETVRALGKLGWMHLPGSLNSLGAPDAVEPAQTGDGKNS